MADKNILKSQPAEHIGPPPHIKRNLLLVAGSIVVGGMMGLLYWHWGQSDRAAIDELQHFRQQMASQCKDEQFARPVQPKLNALYADSSRMQTVVHAQLRTLRSGQADCEQILKSIKSVDFPVE